MAMAMRRYVTACIARWRRSRALLEATGHRHWASIMSDNINQTWLQCFFNIFIVKTVGKDHGSMLRTLILIGVWHIKWKRRAKLRWVYNLLGGSIWQNNLWRSSCCIAFVFVGTVSRPQLRTLIKTRNFVTFSKILIHVGMHHTTWTLKKHSFTHSFFPAAQLFPLRVGCHVGCPVGCCVVVVFLSLFLFTLLPRCQHRHCRHCWHAAAAATAIGRCGGWCYFIVWAIGLSDGKKSGTKIQHGLRRLPNTNKNATTNQKHVGLTGKRWDMRHDWRGAQGERNLIVLGQLSWGIVQITKQ